MPIKFTEINSLPDIITASRHTLFFPQITGVDSRTLTLTKTRITLPQRSVGHIQAKLLGHSVGFRGNLSFENVVSISVLEVATGVNLRSLTAWAELVRKRDDGTSLFKGEYAKDGTFEVYSTTGKLVYSFTLVNMWPIVIQYPDYAEDSSPAEYSIQFNVDNVVLSGETLSMAEFNSRVNGVT